MLLKKIRFMAFIAACSLLGIFLLQGYWLYNTYLLASDDFKKEIQEVMQQLKNRHMVSDLKTLGLPADSSEKLNPAYLIQIADFLQSGTQLPLKFKNLDSLDSTRSRLHRSSQKTITMTITSDLDEDSLVDSARRMPRSMNKKNIIFFNTANRYSDQELKAMVPPLSKEVDSLLTSKQIYSDFSFRLVNLEGPKNAVFSNAERYARHSKEATDATLGFNKPFQFSLVVSNQSIYIFRHMQWVLLSSLVIIGITLWAFLYMLRTIFQQKRLSDMKNDFINNMTHEFKTPLSTVSLAVEAVKEFTSGKSSPQTIEYLNICEHELKRISGMVDKVLKAATFEQGKIRLTIERSDLNSLVQNVIVNMRPLFESRQAQLHLEGLENLPEAWVDRDQLSNVFYNLLDNALKYSDRRPVITIRGGTKAPNELELQVSDNGIGIPAAYQGKVFDNFFRVPTGNVHDTKGFGLGLSYSASVVKAHHGELSVNSSPGKGSTFSIRIPIKQP